METRSPADTVLDSPDVPLDRLYRVSPDVYHGMIEHGLLTGRDRVAFADGLLVHGPDAGAGAGTDPIGRLYRIPLDVYHEMARLGLLTKDDRTVLLDGLLVKTMTKGCPHVLSTNLAWRALERLMPAGWYAAKEDPLTLPAGPSGHGSEPEPDVYVVRGDLRDYKDRHPGPDDLALVVEVADSSLRDDREGLARYAWQKIPVAWIVNLTDGTVEVYSRPTGPAEPAKYEDGKVYQKGDRLPVVVDGREVGRVAVHDLLP